MNKVSFSGWLVVFCVALLVAMATGCVSAASSTVTTGGTSTESAAYTAYVNAKALWEKSGIHSYRMKGGYGAFSPYKGTWEVWVTNDVVTKGLLNGNEVADVSKTPLATFTVTRLFELAAGSYAEPGTSMFVITATYDPTLGFVREVAKSVRKGYEKSAPTDSTWRYSVSELVQESQ